MARGKKRSELIFEHLATNLPNRRWVHWIIRRLNARMERDQSRYELHVRYRKPKSGHWPKGSSATLKRHEGKKLAVYVRVRPRVAEQQRIEWVRNKARWEAEKLQRQQERGGFGPGQAFHG